ncbi:hypothetical protein F4778DRAFT_743810 [Xylariomycetidae sp. FL2044]|nr:hypothetical protein F4778DRAFT_743810 [Xylariomycetidae sp. FL2044]
MGQSCSHHAQSLESQKPLIINDPPPPPPTSLTHAIDRIAEQLGARQQQPAVAAAVADLADLVPGLRASVSLLGARIVTHEHLSGSCGLNDLGALYMRLGAACAARDAPFRTRRLHGELMGPFRRLYKESEKAMASSRIAGRLTPWREFTFQCVHCVNPPWYAIPEGRGDGLGAYSPCYVREEVFRELRARWCVESIGAMCSSSAVGGQSMGMELLSEDAIRQAAEREEASARYKEEFAGVQLVPPLDWAVDRLS